ncbi:MAG: DUF418 domain-containing protein [Elstera sp.]
MMTPDLPPRRAYADRLRGFALFGICLVNLPILALPLSGLSIEALGLADAMALLISALLVDAKFFILFSFLFGFGLSVQTAGRTPEEARRSFFRRLSGLFILGLLHGFLLFPGDILTTYALLGLGLWSLRDASDRVLHRCALLAILVAIPAFTAFDYFMQTLPSLSADAEAAAISAYRGSLAEILGQRWQDWPEIAPFIVLYNWPMAFAAFCWGLIAGRRGLLAAPDGILSLIHRYRWGLWLGAVFGNGAYVLAAAATKPDDRWFGMPFLVLGGPCLAMLYAGWIARLDGGLARILETAGRVSLSHYLGQSLCAVLIFNGLGFYAEFGYGALFLLSVLIAAGLTGLGSLWLTVFRYGPAEWLLRCWTYGRWLPIRL